ncbi:MAG: hypothetical protein RL238_3680 [Actinomycetota bacterium]
MRPFTRTVSMAALALLPLAAVACSASDSDSSSAEVPAEAPSDGGGQSLGDTAASEGGDAGATATTTPGVTPPDDERSLIIEVTVGLEVDDVAHAVNEVIGLARTHGGELSASSVDLSDPEFAGGDMVFRLPPEETDAFISSLDPGIGRRTQLQTSTEDVTLQVTDLAVRIESARASLDRVQALLAEAKDLGEVIALESELTERQTTLEQLLAQQTYLDGRVAMSTVTVHLSAAPPEAEATGSDGIGDSFRKGWDGFVAFVGGVVRFIGYTLPFLLLLAVGALVAWRVSRRVARRNRSAAPLHPPVPDEDRQMSVPGS